MHGVFDGVVEGGGVEGFGFGEERFAQLAHEAQEGGRVEGEGSAAPGVGGGGVRHGGELGAGEVVAVHGDEGGEELGGAPGGKVGVVGIEVGAYKAGEGGFTCLQGGAW